MDRMDPKPDQQDRKQEVPGDTDSADIVGRTGEQMPVQSHDGLAADDRARTDKRDANKPAVSDYDHE